MSNYKAAIFDLDGTLINTLESLAYSMGNTLKSLGLKDIPKEKCREFIGSGARLFIERSLEWAGDKDLSLIEKAEKEYFKIFDVYCTYKLEAYQGITALLEKCKEDGMKLAVFSNKPHNMSIKSVESVFGNGTFDFILGQQDGKARKPHPDGIYEILETLEVDIKDAIFIGDSEIDMQTGHNAKIKTVGVTWGFRSVEDLMKENPETLVNSTEELSEILFTL
ncbi:MAG: HAD family hydrolase [Lachnospiraceae bacterium]|jgi:phosphoglycolate phosphatase|nr:HAD family hydrolase [Lachnospiraceae bacterium]